MISTPRERPTALVRAVLFFWQDHSQLDGPHPRLQNQRVWSSPNHPRRRSEVPSSQVVVRCCHRELETWIESVACRYSPIRLGYSLSPFRSSSWRRAKVTQQSSYQTGWCRCKTATK